MVRAKIFLAGTAAALLLTGCTTGTGGYKQPFGALLGGAAGGFAGSQIGSGSGRLAATAGGALLGAFLGQEAGASLDRADQAYARSYYPYPSQQVPQRYYGAPQPSYYAYAPPPVYGTVAPWSGSNCRYLPSNYPGGPSSVACQAPNGVWYIER